MLLNKVTVLLIGFTIVLLVVVFILEYNYLDIKEASFININLFYQNSYFYIKLIITFISIYLFSQSITSKGDFTAYTLRMFNYKRIDTIASKIGACFIIILFLSIFSFVTFLGVGLMIEGFHFEISYFYGYLSLCFSSVGYGLVGLCFMQVIDNYYIIIVVCVLSLLISGIEEEGSILDVLFFIIPKVNELGISFYGLIHLIWLDLLYFVFSIIIYELRDLNY